VAGCPSAADLPASPRYALNRAIFDLARVPDKAAFLADKAAYLSNYGLSAEAREALLRPDLRRLLQLGALPNLVYRYYILHGFAPESFPRAVAAADTTRRA
jgi:Aromatic-ring-opening dioxygenase LigAB, LigA subunit